MPVVEGAENEGAAAEAIRAAEIALARQNSVTAQVDLAVVTAVLNAHTVHTGGATTLESLQREIEAAVATRTALDTPAGAREFQRYLIDKLGDIRAVVEETDLDDRSKASLAAALASLYANAGSGGGQADAPVVPAGPAQPETPAVPGPASTAQSDALREPGSVPAIGSPKAPELGLDGGLSDFGPLSFPGPDPLFGAPSGPPADAAVTPLPPSTQPAGPPPPVAPPMPAIPALPSLGGGPAGVPPLDGLGSLPALAALADRAGPDPSPPGGDGDGVDEPDLGPAEAESDPPAGGAGTEPPFAGVIAAAVSGTPIADAFDQQGMAIPEPGTPVSAPLGVADVVPGDIGFFADRHALALGNGKVLLDDQIQPIETVDRPGFIGWQHPPEPDRSPEPDR